MAGLRLLVVNAGSTSLKLSVVGDDDASSAVASIADAPDVDGVVHRVVHGGPRLREPVLVDDDVRAELERATELAPLHNGPAVEEIDRARAELPEVPHVAVFDTAFHGTIPPEASTYAVPQRWREEWGIRRYGFHGLSVAWSAERVPVPRLVVCHLGGGCSVTAVLEGRSVDTTMGFTPLEGVPMATRPGSIDPEILLFLLRHGAESPESLEQALEHESGLLALGGSTRVEELQSSVDPDAELALGVFCYRVAAAVAAMTAALGGIDALVFTAGIGEGSALVRERVCGRLAHLGVRIDRGANASAQPDAEVAADGSGVRIWVVHAREDVVAARAARPLL